MDKATAAGLNLVRAWAHTVSPEYALQTAPGQYNEAVFRGLDYALDQARLRGLKVGTRHLPASLTYTWTWHCSWSRKLSCNSTTCSKPTALHHASCLELVHR